MRASTSTSGNSSRGASGRSKTPETSPDGAPAARLDRLLEALAGKEAAPASGSAAAAVLAAASALLEKCAHLSSVQMPDAALALSAAHALRRHAEELVEQDTHAYLDFVEAKRSSKGLTGAALAEALEPAAARTIGVPLEIVRASSQVVELAERLAAEGNPKLRADAEVAAILCDAAAAAGALLVRVNAGTQSGGAARDPRLDEAERVAESVRTRARRLASPTP